MEHCPKIVILICRVLTFSVLARMFVRTFSALKEKLLCQSDIMLSLRKVSFTEHGQLPYITSVADNIYCGALFFSLKFFKHLPVRTSNYN